MVPTQRDSEPANWFARHIPSYSTPSFPPEATQTPGPPLALPGGSPVSTVHASCHDPHENLVGIAGNPIVTVVAGPNVIQARRGACAKPNHL